MYVTNVIDRQTILLAKQLMQKNYKDKYIQMITGLKQPYISKLRNGKIQRETKLKPGEEIVLTNKQKKRLNVLNKIKSLPENMTQTQEQDVIYIHVLRFFMIEKEDIFNLYYHWSKKQFNRVWVKKNVDIRKFYSENIGIPYEDYLDLIIDFFI